MRKQALTKEQYEEVSSGMYRLSEAASVLIGYCSYHAEHINEIAYIRSFLECYKAELDRICEVF